MSLFVDSGNWGHCRACQGNGKRFDWKTNKHTDETCYKCRGTGHNLTEIGRELFDLLHEQFGLAPQKRDA